MSANELIDRYLAHLRKESCSKNTISDRRRTLSVLDRELPYGLETACRDELEEWLWREDLSMGSRETYHGCMTSFYRWGHRHGYFDFDPTEGMARPKVPKRLPRPVTDEQLMDALARAREPYLTWIKLATWSGMRCMDVSNQLREDITLEAVMIRKSKGAKARVIPTHPLIWEAIADLRPGHLTEHDPRHISVSTANYFARTMKMPGVSLHRFRHWFGTQVQRKYRNLLVTQQLLGHENPATTAGYALVAAEETRGAIDLLPVFDVVRAAVPAGRPGPVARAPR